MIRKRYPVIDPAATGANIKRLRLERGLSVRDLQEFFGFEEPQAIYKWQRGESLPSVDNLYALGSLLEVSINEILVPAAVQLKIVREQQGETCCSPLFPAGSLRYDRLPTSLRPIYRSAVRRPRRALRRFPAQACA